MEIEGAQGNEPSAVATATTEVPSQGTSTPATPTQSAAPAATPTPNGFSSSNPASDRPVDPPAPAFTPNLKFKVLDKELEIDKMFHGIVKDAETEKKIRELHEKAYGLDHIKADRQTIREENVSLKSEIEQTTKSLNALSHFVQTDNLHAFFEALHIPEEKVLKYALQRVQYREMAPEQRAQFDGQTQAQRQAYYLQQQNEELLKSSAEHAETARRTELGNEIGKPEISQIAQAFDARVGKPGAFEAAVIERGQFHWYTSQKDIPVQQAVNEVLMMIGAQPNATTQVVPNGQAPTPLSQAGQSQVPGQAQQKPVIPNVRGSGSSPAKRIPKSIDDIRKMASERT